VRVYGVDFSGARDAGRRIWIAEGIVEGGGLRVGSCFPAAELPGGGRDRETAHAALASFVAGLRAGSVLGIDAPFGLPRAITGGAAWDELVAAFPFRYGDPAAFRLECVAAAGGRELRRQTDMDARTPFSPYNLRLFRQTYHALRLLAPLVSSGAVRVAPMQLPGDGVPTVVEVCPASTLKRLGLYSPYKGRRLAGARHRLLAALEAEGMVSIAEDARARAVADPGGDAVDGIVAAVAARRAAEGPVPTDGSAWRSEGFVYA
jgi:Protein of unknown function (DUF429)